MITALIIIGFVIAYYLVRVRLERKYDQRIIDQRLEMYCK